AVVDAVLDQDPYGRAAIETVATRDYLLIAGEITAQATVDLEEIARAQIRRLGYTDPILQFTDQSPINVLVHAQSPEIAVGVEEQGAGDQGMMFGYACRDTGQLMPLPIMMAHSLTRRIDRCREERILPYLRPDGKAQVTVDYVNGKPVGIQTVVLAVPHLPTVKLEDVRHDLYEQVVKPVLSEFGYVIDQGQLIVNGTGVWHLSGPASDTGLTGRKIVVDTYGGYARVGGGCFSGKDPTKVDRSGAYAARFLAKNLVAAGLADRAEVSLAYCIGVRQPVMKEIETFHTEKKEKKIIREFVDSLLDTSVAGIIEGLQLRQPIYLPTAAYGHFGREEFPWERVAF
ncbi:methionine adenosyltransferase, partial [Patescibacteria group bacterium]|nr:methionine adenosyltransferase [Patescibacteria group bacterium]